MPPHSGFKCTVTNVHTLIILGRRYSSWGDLTAAFQYLKGPARKLERDFLQGCVVTGQGVMALN